MSQIRTICVYCGSSPGTDPAFVEAAQRLGQLMAENRIGLVYGGGSVGLMGELSASVLKHGGVVTGVIPEFLKTKERIKTGAQEIIVTADMHERKRIMFERADAFVALPGGIGTLEELVEQLTWAQLGRHPKPILAVNIKGFWNPLLALIDHMAQQGFMHSMSKFRCLVANTVEDVIPTLEDHAPPPSADTTDEKILDRL